MRNAGKDDVDRRRVRRKEGRKKGKGYQLAHCQAYSLWEFILAMRKEICTLLDQKTHRLMPFQATRLALARIMLDDEVVGIEVKRVSV